MLSLDQTPMPMLPSFGDVPSTPKRARRTSTALNRRVRANLNMLSIPDIQGSMAPLQLMPQGRAAVSGLSFENILLNGTMKNKQDQEAQARKSHVIAPVPKPVVRTSPNKTARKVVDLKTGSPIKAPNNCLMALRMASMVKGSVDAKAQLKYGGLNKTFQLPGRARSSPYRPSRALPTRNLNRSFNALCA